MSYEEPFQTKLFCDFMYCGFHLSPDLQHHCELLSCQWPQEGEGDLGEQEARAGEVCGGDAAPEQALAEGWRYELSMAELLPVVAPSSRVSHCCT